MTERLHAARGLLPDRRARVRDPHTRVATAGLVALLLGAVGCTEPLGVEVLAGAHETIVDGGPPAPPPTLDAGDGGPAEECRAPGVFAPPEDARLNLIFLVEATGASRKDEIKELVEQIIGDPGSRGMRVGLSFFPRETRCDPTAYTELSVPLDALGADQDLLGRHEETLLEALSAKRSGGSIPSLYAAVSGTLGVARAEIQARPHPAAERMVIISILGSETATKVGKQDAAGGWACETIQATEGWAQVRRAVGAGQEQSPPITTFIVPMGSISGSPAFLTEGARAAAAGGGAVVIAAEGAASLLDELRRVALAKFDCEYGLPPPPAGQEFDLDRVNVAYANGDGPETLLTRVDGLEQCGLDGWFYDDPASPTRVVLCSGICETARVAGEPRVTVQFGCQSRVPR